MLSMPFCSGGLAGLETTNLTKNTKYPVREMLGEVA
jgi:hypothetical protein